jgi:hypothetical protein
MLTKQQVWLIVAADHAWDESSNYFQDLKVSVTDAQSHDLDDQTRYCPDAVIE